MTAGSEGHMILVFDGECLLCTGWVKLLLRSDEKRKFRFATVQSAAGRQLLREHGIDPADPESFLLVSGERHYRDSAAVLRVAHQLGWPWRLAWLFWIVPGPLRDAAYRWVARNRYRWFGKRDSCYVPSEEDKARFLD